MVAIESSTREVSLVAWRGGEVVFGDSFTSDSSEGESEAGLVFGVFGFCFGWLELVGGFSRIGLRPDLPTTAFRSDKVVSPM